MIIINKKCPKCKEVKELNSENFYKSNQTKSGYKCYCKLCVNTDNNKYDKLNPKQLYTRVIKSRNRSIKSKQEYSLRSSSWAANNREKVKNSKLKREYGITYEEFVEIFNSQNGSCKICNKKLETLHKNTHIDHCHNSNKIRGILCSNCNVALGHFKDNIETIENAVAYLKNNII